MFSHQSFKRNLLVFGNLFKIQAIYWLKNPMNLFLGLMISLYTMLCWIAFKTGNPFLMISGILAGIVRNAMHLHLRTIINFRSKGIFGRVIKIPVSDGLKYASLFSFNIFYTGLIALLMFGIALAAFPQQVELLQQSNQSMVWAGIIFCWLTSVVIAHFLSIFVKKDRLASAIGSLIYFTSMYFLGLGFPFNAIISVDWLNYLLYLHPFRYVMNLAQAGFVNRPDMFYDGIVNGQHIVIDFGYARLSWLPYLLAITVVLIYGSAYYFTYLWFARSFKPTKNGRLKLNDTSSRYLQKIKKAQSVEEIKVLEQQRQKYWKEVQDE